METLRESGPVSQAERRARRTQIPPEIARWQPTKVQAQRKPRGAWDVRVLAHSGAPGLRNGYHQYDYLMEGSKHQYNELNRIANMDEETRKKHPEALRDDYRPFTGDDLDDISRTAAARMGKRFGQLRIIVAPRVPHHRHGNSDYYGPGLYLGNLAAKLAHEFGLTEHGWYAAAHYNTKWPHIHFVAETETADGKHLRRDNTTRRYWQRLAIRAVTKKLGYYRIPDDERRERQIFDDELGSYYAGW